LTQAVLVPSGPFSDNQPKILVQQRLIQVNGLFRHGFLIAPVVLKQLTFSVNQLLAKGSMENSPYGDLLAINKG
ncbi:MAG: hypothetical protein QMC13_09720, partial [Colwellia sp.]